MILSSEHAHRRLAAHDHGVLGTVHAERGVDLVPVVYTAVGGHVGVPVDLVKPKASTRLQRERNLEADPRATLLVERWDPDDWSQLWWVRAELRWQAPTAVSHGVEAGLADELAARFEQYREHPFARVLVFQIVSIGGWAAEG